MTAGPRPSTTPTDPLASLDAAERATLSAIADRLIPAAHGMPSAADVLGDDRLRFVLNARPDLIGPLQRRSGASSVTTSRRASTPSAGTSRRRSGRCSW